MIRVFANNTDISESVEYSTLKLTRQANNRRDTASFTSFTEISEATEIEIYKGSIIVVSGTLAVGSVLITLDSAEHIRKNFFRVGDKIILDPETSNVEFVTVTSISGKNVGISATRYTHTDRAFVGKKLFGGIVMKTPRREIHTSEVVLWEVSAVDYSKLLDQEAIVDTYQDMYPREIIGRAIYKFTADDITSELTDAETLTGWTNTGVARAVSLNSSNKVYKNQSISTGATGAGVGSIKFTFTASDFSAYDKVRFWNYQKNYIEDEYSSIKFRIGKGVSYFEWDAVMAGDVWSYESGTFADARIVGTPSKADLSFFEIEFTALRSSATGSLLIDHTFMGKNGFTIRNVERGNVIGADIRAQYKKPASFIENIAKTNGFFWYVDYFRDINFFANNARTAPFSLTNVSTNFSNLKITADITNLKNRQTVRGGQSPGEFLYDQEKVVDGIETSYRLDYKPKTLQIFVDTGSGYVLKTSGIENIVAESTVDFVFNFNEKTVRNASIATLTAGTKIKFVYYPYRDIRVQVQDTPSITRMKSLIGGRGIFDGEVINDESIKTFDDARARARAELKAYANPIITGTFTTEESGLDVGQVLRITDPQYATDDDFLVQKVTISFRGIDYNPVYSVESGSTLFGLIEFFQLLMKRSAKDTVDVSELVDVVHTVDEVMIIGDVITKRKKAPPFYAHSRTGNYVYILDLTEGGTTLDAYADFCQAG